MEQATGFVGQANLEQLIALKDFYREAYLDYAEELGAQCAERERLRRHWGYRTEDVYGLADGGQGAA